MGGSSITEDSIEYSVLPKTSLWVIRKATWINGPKLPQFLLQYDLYCATAVNSTTVLFFFIGENGISKVITYNIIHNIWTILPQELSICDFHFPWCLGLCTCTSSQTRLGKR